jgi:hypothetical protein
MSHNAALLDLCGRVFRKHLPPALDFAARRQNAPQTGIQRDALNNGCVALEIKRPTDTDWIRADRLCK